MSTAHRLPSGFADLERFVPDWTHDSEAARNRKRLGSTMAQLTEYYDALLARMDAIAAHLDAYPLDNLPQPERNLLRLALMFMEVAPATELFHQPDVPEGFTLERFEILQA